MNNETTSIAKRAGIIKIAIDMHQSHYRVVRQIDHSQPEPAQKFKPVEFFLWVGKQLSMAEEVVVCYEAGCFGYQPARRMEKMGVKVYVIAPQNWDEQGKGQVNDKHDAQVICRRLSEYLCGHQKALSIVRIPSPQEEERRARGRLREQLRGQLRRIQAMGRSLLVNWELPVQGRWWAQLHEPGMAKAVPAWVITHLESWKPIAEAIEKQLDKIEAELRAAAPRKLIHGEGELTHELLARELIDPHRFRNARQVGNYFGLCPSESTSAERRRLGAITKHGNPRLRRLMVEMAWRVTRFQPNYRGLRRWGALLEDRKASAAARKKAIVALARQLAVDHWRIATGRVQAQELGLLLRVHSA
jgi:transposase